jgi:flagellar protein FlaJ
VSPLASVPLAAAVVFLLPVALSPFSRRADLLLTRAGLALFGGHVGRSSRRHTDQQNRLRAARVRQSHRLYAARTLVIAALVGLSGGVLLAYGVAAVLTAFGLDEQTLRDLAGGGVVVPPEVAAVVALFPDGRTPFLICVGAVFAVLLAAGTYYARWEVLNQRAVARASAIEATLPRTVAFVYALSRSGTAFPKVLETVSRNSGAYGEAAEELGLAAREMDVFGTDAVTAVSRLTDHTPSETMDEFADNLASVLGSGRSLAPFLREQYDRYQDEARSQQEQYLDLLSTFAEVYVTVFVALPIFLITILGVVGLVLEDTLSLLRFLGYVALPLMTFGYVVYVDSVTESLPDRSDRVDDADRPVGDPRRAAGRGRTATDGGTVASARDRLNAGRLATYDRVEGLRRRLQNPGRTLVEDPRLTLLLTVPLGLAWLLARSWPVPLGPEALAVVDGPVVEATVFVLAGFALAHELGLRRTREVDRAVPDLLDRMASLDEAGLTVTASLERATRGDLGALGEEIERTWRDIEWGADAEAALRRLNHRIGSVAVSQATALVTNAMRASGDLAPVLRIAADEAQQARRLRRERRREMFTYLLVIYISALVFLGVSVGIVVAFFPAIESAAAAAPTTGNAVAAGPGSTVASGLGEVNLDAYRTLFFHLAAIQAVCSGLVAGQLGEGGVADGVKHAAILLALTRLVYLFV